MVAQAIFFHVFHSFLTFYESWTAIITCIHAFYTLGNVYIEAFFIFGGCFRCSSIIPCLFSFAAPF